VRGECKDIFVESDMSRPLVGLDYDISDVMLQIQKKGSSADLIKGSQKVSPVLNITMYRHYTAYPHCVNKPSPFDED